MAKENANLPSNVEEKMSFIESIMKMFKRTSKLIDSNGRVKYISYPPKKGFTQKQIDSAKTLVVKDVDILGNSVRELKNLERLVLGDGVLAIAYNALDYSQIKELELLGEVIMIPEGAVDKTDIKKVTGPRFSISTTSKNTTTSIYTDQDDRLHFKEDAHFSLGQVDDINSHRRDPKLETEAAAKSLAKQLLKSTSKHENSNSVFVYAEGLGSDNIYSIHAITDKFPMPSSSIREIPDEKLIGLLIAGTEEADISSLEQYPNLTNIVVGKDVKRVIGGTSAEKANYKDEDVKEVFEQKTPDGKIRTISFVSDNTLMMQTPVAPPEGEELQKVKDRELDK